MRLVHGSKVATVLIVVSQRSIFTLCNAASDAAAHKKRRLAMMTQPIQKFQTLTSETAAGNDYADYGFVHADRRALEREARYARAIFMIDAGLWLARLIKRAVAAVKADIKLRAAEA